ncbi:MAG: MFS transporter [Acetobacteraceae bacterium]|nr:MFS transporter [Acetobacteraceae bacterium]
MTSLFLANGAGWGAWAASIPGVKAGLALSDTELGAALLCVAGGAMLAMPLAGWLGAKHVKLLLTGTGIVFMLALPLPGLAANLPVLAGTLLLVGAGAGSMDVCMNARASEVERRWGAAIMSSFHAAFSLGGLLGTGIVALAAGLHWGVLGGLLVTALLLGACVASHLVLDPTQDLADRDRAARMSWPSKAAAGLGALCLLAFMSEGAVADWSGVFLSQVAAFSPASSTTGLAAFSAAMVLARLGGDRVVRRFGRTGVLRMGGLGAAAGFLLAIAIPQAGPIGFGLVGLFAANMAPILFSAAGRAGPAASTGVAAVATMGYAGMLLGPPVIGFLADHVGLRSALLLLVLGALAIGLGARRATR